MSARSVVRFADWTIGPDTGPTAPPVTFSMRCTACDAASETGVDFEAARDWAFGHVGRNPSHTGYRELVHRSWRAALLR
ncbi:hypothetical protein ACFQ2B_38050 [Streptomyces stramineus]|uniref:DUF7848 domain-containing protein n=1 Tax=Streptomyces stramineus TaxID=173861 RepID=A0ABP3K8J1_9ACTN